MSATKKSELREWMDQEYVKDPGLKERVEEMLTEMELEDSLVALRERAGLSQTTVAKRLGVSQPAVARLESDKVRNAKLSTLVRYAIVVGGRLKIEIAPGKQRAKIVDLKRAAKA